MASDDQKKDRLDLAAIRQRINDKKDVSRTAAADAR